MFDISPVQIIIVLVIALLIFGPRRLPEMGRSIGQGIREFKSGIFGDRSEPEVRAERAPAPEPTRAAEGQAQ
ncbi:MAG: twin-arginine translocase TatA/TatE family subunit [Thermoleophilia bacterium]